MMIEVSTDPQGYSHYNHLRQSSGRSLWPLEACVRSLLSGPLSESWHKHSEVIAGFCHVPLEDQGYDRLLKCSRSLGHVLLLPHAVLRCKVL